MILYDTREENQVVISIPILKSPVRGGVRRGGGGEAGYLSKAALGGWIYFRMAGSIEKGNKREMGPAGDCY